LWYFLERVDLQPGDEVLVSAYNFYVMVRLIVQKGLVPVFVDIEPTTLNMDAQDLARKVTSRSRLVLVTHMFGQPANLREIKAICDQHDLLLFEDCAHAIGTRSEGEQVGQAGDGALFSFGVEKLINTFGGGMLVLADRWAEGYQPPKHPVTGLASFGDTLSRCLVTWLMTPQWYGSILYPAKKFSDQHLRQLKQIINPAKDNPEYRFEVNSRAPFKPFMVEMQARQLARLSDNISRRREIIHQLKRRFSRITAITLLDEDKHGQSNGSYFGICVPDPEALTAYLEAHGIDANPHEFYNCAALDQFAPYHNCCPQADYASGHLLRLPSYPWLRAEEVEHIGNTIEQFFS
jgi:dTDP-4-amino-4,6-dideoxygalactose transaminase